MTSTRRYRFTALDDFDSAMKDMNCRNILKAALENDDSRDITYRSKILTFSSAIIFISNEARFDTALLSRAINVKIDLKNEQMIDRIEKTMKDFHPEIDISIKKEALGFLKEISKGVRSIDYREFEKVIISMQIAPKKWRQYATMMLQSQE